MEICPKCGLPKEACVCEVIAKTAQKINLDEPKAIKLVEEERGAIPLNQ